MAYGASKRNPQNWFFSNLNNDSRIYDKVNIEAIENGFRGKGESRLSVTTSARYSQSKTTQDHDKSQAQGFMMTRYDWRDVEITGQVRFVRAGKNAKISFFSRSGDITRPCEGIGYGIEITPDGMTTCSVRQFYPGGTTELDHSHEDRRDIEGQLIGFKVCIFNNPENNHVMLQGFIDHYANGQYKMVCSVTDTGLGIHGDRCSTNKNQVITWGGPLTVFNMSGEDIEDVDESGNIVMLPTEVEVTKLSIREIDPFNKFGVGGGIMGAGFHIEKPITVTPDPIVIEPEPAPFEPIEVEEIDDVTNPDIINHLIAIKNQRRAISEITKTNRNTLPSTIHSDLAPINKTGGYTAGNASMILYKKTGRTATMVEGPFKTRHYASGKPDDVTKEWNASVDSTWRNYTVCFYVTITRIDHDDAISTKVYGPNHSDGNCCWYIWDIGFQRGNAWFAYEHPHPSTTKTNDAVGAPVGSIVNKKIGIQIVISQVGSGAKMEVWLDTGDSLWRKHSEKLNIGGRQYSPGSVHRPQIRIDAAPGITMHDVKLFENTPGLEFVGTGGGTTAPPPPPESDIVPIPDWGDIGDSGVGGGVVIGDGGGTTTPPPTGGTTLMSKPYAGGLGRLTAQLTGKVSTAPISSPTTVNTSLILSSPATRGMVFGGGYLLANSTIYFIFAGSDWNTRTTPYSRQNVIDAVNSIFSSTYFDALIQYDIKRPKVGGFVTNTTYNFSNPYTPYDIGKCAKDSIMRGQVPSNAGRKEYVYVVLTASGMNSAVNASGYSITYTEPGQLKEDGIHAAAVHYYTFNVATDTITNEIVEKISCPIMETGKYGWYADSSKLSTSNGILVADVCEHLTDGVINGITVSQYYSNQHGSCQYSPSAPTFVSCHTGATWNNTTQKCVPLSQPVGPVSSIGNVIFNDGTSSLPVENWNTLTNSDKIVRISAIETIPFGTLIWEDGSITIRKDNTLTHPPSNYTGITIDYVTFKNGTKQIVTSWNNMLDQERYTKASEIATIPYGTMIYEDASIGVWKPGGTQPPTNYTGKVASYTTAINPNLTGSSTSSSTVTANITGSIVGVGTEETRATYAGVFNGVLSTNLIGDIQGTLEGSGNGIANTTDGGKTGKFYADMTGSVTGSGTSIISGKTEGTYTGVSVPIGTDSGGNTGETGGGNTGGGTGTPTPDKAEPSPVYVEKKLQIIWAIDSMEGDPCNINSPYEDTALEEVFNAAPDDIYVETRSYRRVGVFVNRPTSKLIGRKIRNVKVIMNKEGLDTLQGKVFLRIRSGNRNIVEEFPDIIDASLIINEDITYEFTHDNPIHTIERGDFIYLEYPAGGNINNYIRIKITETDKADGEASCLVTYDGLNEIINVDKDPGFIISV